MADLSDTTPALPPKNHNNPPSDIEMLGETLTLKFVHLMRPCDDKLEIAKKMPGKFTDENEAAYTIDFIKESVGLQKTLERARKQEKDPFLRQGQYVDTFFGEYTDKLQTVIDKAQASLNEWLQRKAKAEQEARDADAKMLREQKEAAFTAAADFAPARAEDGYETTAERAQAVEKAIEISQQARVAEAIAAAPLTSMARSVSDTGSAKLATKWVGKIADVEQLDLHKLRPYLTLPELQKALDRFVKAGGRSCDGADIKETLEAKVK